MKKTIIMKLLFLLTLILCCNKKEHNQDENYFDFDTVEFYHKETSSDDLMKEYEKSKENSNHNKINLKILQEAYPSNITDSFIKELIEFGYKKKIVPISKHTYINDFFSKNNCDEYKKTACIPVYKDILIFKKSEKIIGIAKICFRCETGYIVGTKKKWNYFGECNDYEKLEEIIN